MSDDVARHHLERLKSSTISKYDASQIAEWITQNTFINGERYSFKDHEYQERIARDTSPEKVIQKCSQVGISELSARLALAYCGVIRGFTLAYVMPTATFAAQFSKTRVTPIIESSPYLKSLRGNNVDTAEVKQLGDSYIHFKGASSGNAPISVPCSAVFIDEMSFCDPTILGQYHSRLTHSKYKFKTQLSTPTLPDTGISKEFGMSRRHFQMVKCNHCNHYFMPDYFDHVKIPDHEDLDKRTINKQNYIRYRWQEAYVECPSCKKVPDLSPEHREWVCENPNDNYSAVGYQVTPFDAPAYITPAYLVKSSTEYTRYIDFVNFGLGLPAEDSEATLSRGDLVPLLIENTMVATYGSYIMGIDVGLTSYITVGFKTIDGQLIIIHTETVPAAQLREKRRELAQKYRVKLTVVDLLPYTETVINMQSEDQNLFAAVYITTQSMELYQIKNQDEDESKGKQALRQVNINRDKLFDVMMSELRARNVLKMKDENDELWITQLCDMKRVRVFDKHNELVFAWRKSDKANDHFHHSLGYCLVASMMVGVSTSQIALPFMITTRTLEKKPDEVDQYYNRK